MIVFNFKAHIGIGLATGIATSLLLSSTVSQLLYVNIGLENYYYFGGAILGAIIPDLDHHSSVFNGKFLDIFEIVLKFFIGILLYQLWWYITLDIVIKSVIYIILSVVLIKANFKKKWALSLLYIMFSIILINTYGLNFRTIVGAITLSCTGFYPHRGYTHKWYGLAMISISLYLLLGVNALFVGCVVGMISHIASDGLKSTLHM